MPRPKFTRQPAPPPQKKPPHDRGKLISTNQIPQALVLARQQPGLSPRQQRVLAMTAHLKDGLAEKMDVPTQRLVDWLQAPEWDCGLSERLEEVVDVLDTLAIGALLELVTQSENKRVRLRAAEYIGELSHRRAQREDGPGPGTTINIEQMVATLGSAAQSSMPQDTIIDVAALAPAKAPPSRE